MGKTERVELRLDEVLAEKIDLWRRNEPDLPSRSEAIRRLVQQGLSSSTQQAYTVMKTQLLIAAKLPHSEEFLSDACLFAWSHDIYPAFGMAEDELAEPFAENFSVTREMIEKLGEHIDKTWVKRSSFSYYELEREFMSPMWNRGKLVNACKYMYLRDMFGGFWERFLEDGDCPIEAKIITKAFDRSELFIA